MPSVERIVPYGVSTPIYPCRWTTVCYHSGQWEIMKNRAGFTLLEFSIGLAIIGLIIGAVLVGRDQIEAANIRAQISQLQQYKTAVNMFRAKYNALPGDIGQADAARFGLASRTGGPGDGDDNGIIGSCGGRASIENFGCEDALFWNDLGTTNLIPGNYSLDVDGALPATVLTDSYLPDAKIGTGSVVVWSDTYGNSYFQLTGTLILITYPSFYYTCTAASIHYHHNSYVLCTTAALTPLEAFAIDSKMDDGMPLTGQITGGAIIPFVENRVQLGSLLQIVCVATDANGNVIYNTDDTDQQFVQQRESNKPLCSISYPF